MWNRCRRIDVTAAFRTLERDNSTLEKKYKPIKGYKQLHIPEPWYGFHVCLYFFVVSDPCHIWWHN